MLPAEFIWKPILQKAITGQWQPFRMTPRTPTWPRKLISPGLYIHVPFCRRPCPFCPYNRVEYSPGLFANYEQAIKQEISLYAPDLAGHRFASLYVGGGTPTVDFNGLTRILDHCRRTFPIDCDICVELHPASMDTDCLSALKDMGVSMVSIGVESTSDELLNGIGRSYDGQTALSAIERAASAGFKCVNVDLMFALPGQSLAQWQASVKAILATGIDQLSTYPFFSFPYSDMGGDRGLRRVARPPHRIVKSMLDFTHDICEAAGLPRCAVWSWLRPERAKFSSITRHHYVGFGPSAASMIGTEFHVNTFDVEAYSSRLPNERPVALSMPLTRDLEMAYWLYWRIYELKIRRQDFAKVFGPAASLQRQFGWILRIMVTTGLMTRSGDDYNVTRSGAYWIHRMQNEYSLNYINSLWGTCRKQPWPEQVSL